MTTNELLARGIGHNCLSDAYDLGKAAGKAEGYHKAENDYLAKTQKDIENAYNRGYEVGKAVAIDEIDKMIGEMITDKGWCIAYSCEKDMHCDDCALARVRERLKKLKEQKNELYA